MIQFKMLRQQLIILILVFALNFQSVDARIASKIYPSRCLGSDPFMLLDKKSASLHDCQSACADKQHCLAVSYQRNLQLCRLYDVLTSLSPCTGYLTILKSDILVDTNVCSGLCPISDCHHIPSINNAETFGNLLHVGDVVEVRCSHDGSVSHIECQPDGQWTPQPTCSAAVISCGTPVSVANSVISYSSTLVGSIASYTCSSGYSRSPLSATMSITCLGSGQWESIGFTCEQVDCGTPQTIANSGRAYTTTTAGSTVTYTCNSGFTRSPHSAAMSFSCLNTGLWESIGFTCQQVDCGTPQTIANSGRTYTTTTVGSIVTYTCNSGYTSSPNSAAMSFTCLNTGLWESIGFTCQQVDCGTPQTIANSGRTYTTTTTGSIVTYTCNSGYTSSPNSAAMSFTCLNTGLWESIGFSCQQVDCGTPQTISNSGRTYTTTTAGSIVTYTCSSGFTHSPNSAAMSFTCLNTGLWESIGFTCQQVDCGTPQTIADSGRTYTTTTAGSIVTYTCNSGYTSSPDSAAMSFTCLHTGLWESIGFTCQQVDCGTPQTIANSGITYTTTTSGSIVTYTCNSGYASSPDSAAMSFTCLNTGLWESIGFICQQVDCGTPQTIANSGRTYTTTTAGSIVTYTCNSGYASSPDNAAMSLTCLNTGLWESIGFTCQHVDCGTPQTIANSGRTYTTTTAGSIVTYTCNSGYSSSPDSAAMSFTCLNTGLWESIGFICQQVDCGTPQTIANSGRTYTTTTAGSIVTYTCNSGYSSSPDSAAMSFTCLNTGLWESIGFTCQQVDCGTPQTIANSGRTYTTTTAGSIVTYTCNSGYTSSPDNAAMSFTCLHTGLWESIGFTCQQVDCGTPQTIANSGITYTTTTSGSIVTYTCNSGYASSPDSAAMSFTCLNTGLWESIGFICQQVDCGTPQTIANSGRTYTTTTAGSIVTYTCNSGYASSPDNAAMSLTCLNTGLWESIGFTCQHVDCGTPQTIANSGRTYTTTTAGSIVTYTCNSGYSSSPDSAAMSFTCLNTGLWESIGFICQQVDCGTPQTIANSGRTYTTTTAGSIVTYTCNSGYSSSPDSAAMSFTCLNTGLWESIGFTCQQVDCGTPQTIANSGRTYTTTTAGSIVTYTCNSGYTSSPDNATMSFTCLSSGQWEAVSFTCVVDCGTPPTIENGQRKYNSTNAGSSVTYSCDSGYVALPANTAMSVTCQHSGNWESVSFSCTATVPVGTSCNNDGDCVDPAARCLYTGLYSKGSRCYCKPLYEVDQSRSVCTKVCDTYTSLERYTNQYIRKHNVGDSNGATLTEAECLQFCQDNYGDSYLSVDHRHAYTYGTNCYCGSVTRQQILDASPDLHLTDSEYNMFTRTCA